MSLEYPEALVWIVLAWIAWPLVARGRRLRLRSAEAFGGEAAVREEASRLGPFGTRSIVACLLVALAVTGPSIGFEYRPEAAVGCDVVLVVDVSRSMWAADGDARGRARIDVAIDGLSAFVERADAARIGLVTFGGEAQLDAPLTVDHPGLQRVLAGISPNDRRGGGSAVGAGLELALATLERSTGRSRAVVLVSDGENVKDADGVERAIEKARARGITIDSVLVGTLDGGTVPESTERGAAFLRDEAGDLVVSRADPTILQRASDRTRGTHRSLAADQGAFEKLSTANESIAEVAPNGAVVRVPIDRFRWLIVPLVVAFGIVLARGRGNPFTPSTRSMALVAAALALPGFRSNPVGEVDALWRSAVAQHRAGELARAIDEYVRCLDQRDDPRIRFDLAVARLANGEWSLASIEFGRVRSAANDPSLVAASLFGEGITSHRRAMASTTLAERIAHLRRSRDAFVAAARLGLRSAAIDLEYVARELSRAERERDNSGAPIPGETRSDPPPERADQPPDQPPGEGQKDPSSRPGETTASPASSEGEAGAENDPTREGSRAGRSIEQIVREFERRRLAFDREQVVRSRRQEARDW